MKDNFYTPDELQGLGFLEIGHPVYLSRDARFYTPQTIRIGNHVRIDDFCNLSGDSILKNFIHIGREQMWK